MHAILTWIGTTNASGPWYLWWSGIVGDFGLLGIVATLYRKHNCEVHGCWRVGRHDTAAGHTVCRVHHPDTRLTAQDVRDAHRDALRSPAGESGT